MVKGNGLRDWVIQRVSAIVMAIYSIGLAGYLLCHADLFFAEWHGLFARPWMKVVTILFLLALVWHAWIGIWTILTDYVKSFVLRSLLDLIVIFVLADCLVYGVFTVWSV